MAITEGAFKMLPAPIVRDAAPDPPELVQAEYPPDILPVYVAKLYGVSHTPGDPGAYPPPPPPPSDTASGEEPIIPQPPPITAPPVNVDVPALSQDGALLSCTMGNWDNTPTGYSYAWKLDGADAGSDSPDYTAASGDIGKLATCTVTATNANGSTAAPETDPLEIAAFT